MDRLEVAMASSLRHARLGAVVVIDLDNFKMLNDSYGHFKGDLLLQAIAGDLTAVVRKEDTVARMGADEFMVLLTNLSGEPDEAAQQARAFTEKLLSGLRRSYLLGRLHHYSTASIGVTLFGKEHETVEEPMKRADLAMAQVKKSGGNAVRFFEPAMQAFIERRVELEAAMRFGLSNNEFILYYQPQVTHTGIDSLRVVGAESLIRWKSPQQGMISPGEFIPVAEESGLILELGKWVLGTACEQLALWSIHPARAHLTLAVNVSARQFHQADFVATVLQALTVSGANPRRLKLELTEGILVSNVEDVVVKMNSLKMLGVSFSLDDFGTGYSSLSYLKRLPLDQLKIDQGFVRDILTDANDAAIARTVIALADSLGLAIIAEGVETQDQRRFLASEGCLAFQGYLFSRPLPIEDFEGLMNSQIEASDDFSLAA
jgi:diguanylate cyclase (GGDEF)-like protein